MEMPLIHPSPHAKNALPTWGQYASDTADEDARDWWAAMKFVFFAEDKEYMPAYHWAMPPHPTSEPVKYLLPSEISAPDFWTSINAARVLAPMLMLMGAAV